MSLVSGFYVHAGKCTTERIYWAWHTVEMRWALKGHIRCNAVNETDIHSQVLTQRRYTYIYIYIYIYMCVCVCVCVCVYIYIYINIYVCVCVCVCIYALRVSCWDSSVGIVYGLQAERLRNRVSISGREVNFPLVQELQNSSGSHPFPTQFVPTIFSPGIQRQGRQPDRCLHLAPKSRTSGLAPVVPHTPSWPFFFCFRDK